MRRWPVVLCALLVAGTADAQQPRPDLDARVAAGDSAFTAERHADAFAHYDAVVRTDSAYSTRALFRVGVLHSWANRFGPAVAALRLYVRLEASDLEGRIALGRTHAWANQFPEALAQYDTVLQREPRYRDAVTGRATTLAWSGRLDAADSALTQWLAANAEDVGAWTQLAQFRRWQGNARGADAAVREALRRRPDDAEARLQSQWIAADLRPSGAAVLVSTEDSEQNLLTHLEVQASALTAADVRLTLVARRRAVAQGVLPNLNIPSVHVVATYPLPRTLWGLRAEAGAVMYPAGEGQGSTRVRGGLRATGRVGERWRVSTGVGREPFDEVLTMASRELMFTSGDVDLSYAATPRLTLGAAGSVGRLTGVGVERSRSTALVAARYTPRRGATFTLQHREAGWNDPAFGIFFAPQRWSVSEFITSYERPVELGWIYGGDIAVGSQGIRFAGGTTSRSVAPRAAMRVGWRPLPGREVLASLLYANVAGAGAVTASDYRYGAFTLTGRWTF